MDKLFLLDAYALIYRAYYAFIKSPRINSKGFNTSAVLGFVNTLEDVLKKETPTHIGVAFDPAGPTFRHEAYEQYKAQREETPEAIRLSVPIIKDIIRAYRIPILEMPGYEADDVIGTLATEAGRRGITTYMMTPDKDYGQLVSDNVFMYRPKYGDKEFEVMGIEQIKAKFDIQSPAQVIDMLGLMGDSSDNIPGCPGVGEKTAQKLIAQYGSIENLLSHTDELKGALKTKVETNRKMIEFSKFLATIKIDVPITLNMDELKREEPDEEELRKIFEEMEFRTLIDRVFNREKKTASAGATAMSHDKAQGSLFGDQPSLFDQPSTSPSSQASSQGNLFAEFEYENTGNGNYSNLACLENSKYDYQLIDTEEKRTELIQKLLTKETFSLDTETTGTDPITAKLVGMSFSYTENQAFYVPVPAEQNEAQKIVNEFRPVFEKAGVLKVGQNIKYDMLVLGNYGVEVCGPLFDTMVAHYVLQPELRNDRAADRVNCLSTVQRAGGGMNQGLCQSFAAIGKRHKPAFRLRIATLNAASHRLCDCFSRSGLLERVRCQQNPHTCLLLRLHPYSNAVPGQRLSGSPPTWAGGTGCLRIPPTWRSGPDRACAANAAARHPSWRIPH